MMAVAIAPCLLRRADALAARVAAGQNAT
jgi:hypothetical protein